MLSNMLMFVWHPLRFGLEYISREEDRDLWSFTWTVVHGFQDGRFLVRVRSNIASCFHTVVKLEA
jgi:hypothetical protein